MISSLLRLLWKLKKNEQKEKLENDFSDIRDTLGALEEKLSELKQKAYENVTEKLQVFEDEFFADIKNQKRKLAERACKMAVRC